MLLLICEMLFLTGHTNDFYKVNHIAANNNQYTKQSHLFRRGNYKSKLEVRSSIHFTHSRTP
jgi:nicotinic acid phosphoribosyltransferase